MVRVTVASDTCRVDLAVPGAIPLAELVPDLARRVGLLDGVTAHLGYELVTPDGRVLDSECGLTDQGVADGAVLSLAVAATDLTTMVYDDVVEAMGDVVERDLPRVDGDTVSRATAWCAVAFLVLGAGALLPLAGASLPRPPAGTATFLTTLLALVVVMDGAVPRLALAATGTRAGPLVTESSTGITPVDVARVADGARRAQWATVRATVAVGVLLVLLSPCAVSLGLGGAVVAWLASLTVALRSCRHRRGPDVVVGLWGGVLGLLSTAASALWMHPAWRMTLSLMLVGSGTLVLVTRQLPAWDPLVRARLADLAECVVLAAVVPALVVATDLFSAAEGWARR